MKIIHLVLGKANPLRMNGVNKLVHEMATTQKELGYDVSLWGISENPVHDYPKRNFNTLLFPSIFNKTNIDSSLKKAIFDLKKGIVFHIHGSFISEFYIVTRLLVERGIPYVYTPHGALAPAALKRRNWKKKWYFEFFEKKLIRDAQTVVVTGKSVFDNLENLMTVRHKILIPNGQPKLDFRADNPKKGEQLIFGYCGRIALEHKGLDLLLKGFRIFLDDGENTELHIIGDGSEMSSLKKISTELKLDEHIKFHGAKYGDEKFELLCKTNVFVHTSRMEGFPASVLEAAALGLPCLISEHTNLGDYFRKFGCGLVIEKNTPQGIANKMSEALQLLENGDLKQLGDNARAMIEGEFDWKKICTNLASAYENQKSDVELNQVVITS
jgi:glycosyltransferase involved in cell wall biosynthesis